MMREIATNEAVCVVGSTRVEAELKREEEERGTRGRDGLDAQRAGIGWLDVSSPRGLPVERKCGDGRAGGGKKRGKAMLSPNAR